MSLPDLYAAFMDPHHVYVLLSYMYILITCICNTHSDVFDNVTLALLVGCRAHEHGPSNNHFFLMSFHLYHFLDGPFPFYTPTLYLKGMYNTSLCVLAAMVIITPSYRQSAKFATVCVVLIYSVVFDRIKSDVCMHVGSATVICLAFGI